MKRYIIAFVMFSFAGWLWESIYCTICQKKWANRGFLYGPVCPIYGFASLVGVVVYDLVLEGKLPELPIWALLISGIVVSMLLEYPTSFLLEKLFHARWWDYSYLPLNINGRVSVPTSIGFGFAAILVFRVLLPLYYSFYGLLPGFVSELAAYAAVAAVSADLTLTVSALTDFQKRVKAFDDNFQNSMTERVDRIVRTNTVFNSMAVSRVKSFKYKIRKRELEAKEREEQLAEFFEAVKEAIEREKKNRRK